MPRRNDLEKIAIIGSGPIVIGQACEFDYSGTQGAKALAAVGYEVVLVNSNPATIMTDPELAVRTYVEPLERANAWRDHRARAARRALADARRADGAEPRARARRRRRAGEARRRAASARRPTAIRKAEDRLLFKEAMKKIGLESPALRLRALARRGARHRGGDSVTRRSCGRASRWAAPAAASSYHAAELEAKVALGARAVARRARCWSRRACSAGRSSSSRSSATRADNFIVVCSIENIDPMGVHTGDSITVAPGDDAHRSRVPAPARRGARGDDGDRRRDRRLERAVRGQPDGRARSSSSR